MSADASGVVMPWPEPRERLDIKTPDGAVIRVRRHGNPDGPRVMVSHGNGFATNGYFPFWRHLMADYDLAIYDQRSHGENPRHDFERHQVDTFAGDLRQLLEEIPTAFGSKPTCGVFHSLSAIVATAHAIREPWPWQSLVLVDPPYCLPPGHALYPATLEAEVELSSRAEERQNTFDTIEELADKYRHSRMMGRWVEGAYVEMAQALLRKTEFGFELACPPRYEARIFRDNSTLNLTPHLPGFPDVVLYLCADPEREAARGPARINKALHDEHGLQYEAMPGTTHMLQLEQPEAFAARVQGFFAECGVGA